jgi:hypothetical protein
MAAEAYPVWDLDNPLEADVPSNHQLCKPLTEEQVTRHDPWSSQNKEASWAKVSENFDLKTPHNDDGQFLAC